MLIQLLVNQPQAIVDIVRNTPPWVGGLFAGLVVLGATQMRDRAAGVPRIVFLPVAMGAFSLFGMTSTFAAAGQAPWMLVTWLLTALVIAGLMAMGSPAAGTKFDAATRQFTLPGSIVPLLLILGIFFTRYGVNVELAMQPQLRADAGFAIAIAGLYGLFTGLFAGRAARLLRLAFRPAPAATPACTA
jgi:hypothetical protein